MYDTQAFQEGAGATEGADDGNVCFPLRTAEFSFTAFIPRVSAVTCFAGINMLLESRDAQWREKVKSVRKTWRVSTHCQSRFLHILF